MRKAYLLPIGLLLAMILAAVWNSHAIETKTDAWGARLQMAGQLAGQGNWSAAEDTLQAAHADWSAHQIWLRTTIRHDGIDSAEKLYRRAMSFAKTQEPDEFQAEIAELLTDLSLLAEAERLSLRNIL